MSFVYENTRDALMVVPNELRDTINAKLDILINETPDAAADREYLYNTLLGFFDEYGYVPEFSLQKKETT